ncbi:hypothetical protein [Marinomonas posidonica]|uniref:Uncharacterized protein n=1 Tax=Marinomonas posidonica (strain CECT 7376 / NCIMB 14433 / IVIA-Po-181) TaxID=491952 RepID=F6CTQ9_MARPP|nr:hypothetical protein [Marinomonas posidonica]AEF55174.1 hypothetical protein Mar181_2136 [Marinomonas posidonica IVIA-Po-181]
MHSQATIALGAFAIFFVGIALTICLVMLKKFRQQSSKKNTISTEAADKPKDH